MVVLGGVFWAVGLAITVLAAIVIYLTPALFQLCVYLQWQLVVLVEQLSHKRLSHGMLILSSMGGWAAVGALSGALLLSSWFGAGPALVFGVVAGLWGAAVGHQVGQQQWVIAMRRPGFLPHQTPGEAYHWPQEFQADQDPQEGIFIGRRGWPK